MLYSWSWLCLWGAHLGTLEGTRWSRSYQGLALLSDLTPIWLLFWAAVLYGSHCSVSGYLQRG